MKKKTNYYNMSRYKLERSTHPDWWVLTDMDALVVIQFEEHRFNETQKVTILEDSKFNGNPEYVASELARVLAAMGDYMYSHWYSIAMPTPTFELREDDEGKRLLLIRNKFPKFTIEIQDTCDKNELSGALRAASEYIRKRT